MSRVDVGGMDQFKKVRITACRFNEAACQPCASLRTREAISKICSASSWQTRVRSFDRAIIRSLL